MTRAVPGPGWQQAIGWVCAEALPAAGSSRLAGGGALASASDGALGSGAQGFTARASSGEREMQWGAPNLAPRRLSPQLFHKPLLNETELLITRSTYKF